MVKVMLENKALNIVSVYALQMECEEYQKEEFWQEMDKIIQEIQ